MIDIKFLRENPDVVKENIKKKFQDNKLPLVDEVIELDKEARAAQQEADALRASKMEVRLCQKNGAELLNIIEETNPDVVVMDAFMSNLDALGVINQLNEKETKPLLMVMSSADNQRFEQELLSAGADYYFLKPFDVQMLAQRINQLTGWSKSKGDVSKLQETNDLQMTVSEIMHQIGVPAHIKGYQYLREAVRMVIEDHDIINRITKELYPGIADHFNTSPSKVERAIRHAIEVAWNRGRIETLNSAFGCRVCTPEDKPTNGEFIAMLADKLSMERSA